MTQLLTHSEAARALGVDPATLHRWRKQGLIACRKAGRWVRYTEQDLADYLESVKTKAEGQKAQRKSKGDL